MKKQFENVHWVKKLLFTFVFTVIGMTSPHAYAADGDLVWRTNIPTSNGGAPYGGVAVDSTGIYLAGYYFSSIYFGDWYTEKRTLDGGILIWQKINFFDNGVPVDIAADLTGVYTTGPIEYGTSQRTEKRSLLNGNVIWEKKDDYINPSWVFSASENFSNHGIAVNDSGLYVVSDEDSLGATSIWDPTWAQMVSVSNLQWGIVKRSLATGDILWAETSNPSAGKDIVHKVAADNSGVYIVGEQFVGLGFYYTDTQWRIEKRSSATGSLLWVQTIDPSIYGDAPLGVVVDGSGVYIAGTSGSNWRIEKRSLGTGDILWQKEIPPPNAYWGVARDIAINSSGVYIVGSDTYANAGNMNWRIEKRSLDTGDLIWKKIIPEGISSTAFGVATDILSVYTVGWSTVPGSQWFPLEKRESIPNSFCGSADGVPTAVAPDPTPATPPNNLCTGGSVPAVTDNGTSFDWTCDGPDGTPATADDVACTAPKIIPPTANMIAPDCTITAGNNSCLISVSWTSSGILGPISVRQDGIQFSTNPSSGGDPRSIAYGSHVFTFLDNGVQRASDGATASCASGTSWDGATCRLLPPPPPPPSIKITADPSIIRSGSTASIKVEINSNHEVSCRLANADVATINFTHNGTDINPSGTYTNSTRPLTSTQIVTAICTDNDTGLISTDEVRIEVVPTVQEI